jgi:hypothetical protein
MYIHDLRVDAVVLAEVELCGRGAVDGQDEK